MGSGNLVEESRDLIVRAGRTPSRIRLHLLNYNGVY